MGNCTIGLMNISFPCARFSIHRDGIRLSTLLGIYELDAFQVVHFIPVRSLGFHGIKILHRKASYPDHLVFYFFGTKQKFWDEMEATGFPMEGTNLPIPKKDTAIALKSSFLVFSAASLWSLLVIGGFPLFLGGLFLWSLSLHTLIPMQKFGLKRRRHIDEIRHWLRLVLIISFALFLLPLH